MKIKKLDRRYTQCRLNDYWYSLYFAGDEAYRSAIHVKSKLIDHYGPTSWAMFGNTAPWYSEYKNYAKDEVIYLRDASMLTMLQLSGVLDG